MTRDMAKPDPLLLSAVRHHRAGRLQEAEALYRQILAQDPGRPEALHLLGVLAQQSGRAELALDLVRRAVALDPNNALYHFDLGNICMARSEHADAIAAYTNAIVLRRDFSEALVNRASAHRSSGDYGRALVDLERAIALRPGDAEARFNLGNLYRDQMRCREAIESYRAALRLKPDHAVAHSNLLFTLSYHVLCPPREMLEAHRAWDRLHGGPEKAQTFVHNRSGEPDRRLRIGYVSPDLRRHVVSTFIEPLLRHHDRSAVEVYCYAEVARPDAVTDRLRSYADGWRFTVGESDERLARMIYDDRIDILVDLAGHTAGNRLGAFAYRPAPIQATYLGYFTTTGLAAMDYWITDEVLHPADTPELAVETLCRLPRCCVCYQAPQEAPEVAAQAAGGGELTFACFNQLSKISQDAVRLWARILSALPAARLLLKKTLLLDPQVEDQLLEQFAAHGIGPERVIFRPHIGSFRDYLASYGEIDLVLDPIPRTGGTTTCDALWMGAPVLTLAGRRFIERLSATMLAAVGLDALIAHSEDDYVKKAVAFAADHEQRARLRAELRPRMAASPLCDGRGLARALEGAYRQMWRAWCAGTRSAP